MSHPNTWRCSECGASFKKAVLIDDTVECAVCLARRLGISEDGEPFRSDLREVVKKFEAIFAV